MSAALSPVNRASCSPGGGHPGECVEQEALAVGDAELQKGLGDGHHVAALQTPHSTIAPEISWRAM
jgi:hypothetical protein